MKPDINQQFDSKLKTELEKRLKRQAKPNELINADNDGDLVNEVFWQLIVDLADRVEKLEESIKKNDIIKP